MGVLRKLILEQLMKVFDLRSDPDYVALRKHMAMPELQLAYMQLWRRLNALIKSRPSGRTTELHHMMEQDRQSVWGWLEPDNQRLLRKEARR
jgi:hypothetical protein